MTTKSKSHKLQSIFNASPTPQLVVQPDSPIFTIVEVNEAYLRITKTQRSDLIGKQLFEAFPGNPFKNGGDKGVRNLQQSLDQVIATGKEHKLDTQQYDIPLRSTDEFEDRYWVAYNYPVLNDDGMVEYIIHSPIDVTGRVLAEEKGKTAVEELHKEIQFRQSVQEQLTWEKDIAESLINSLPGVFYLFDEQGKMHRWNKNAEIITGYTAEEIADMHPLMFIAESDQETVEKAIIETFEKGKAEVIAQLQLKNGNIIPYHFNGVSIILDGRNFLVGTGMDLTELEKERSHRMRLWEVLERSCNEIYLFDEKSLHFIDVNAGARENLGYSLEELKKMTPLDLKPEFNRKSFRELIRPLKNQSQDKIVFYTVHRRADGSHYDVEVHLQLIRQKGFKIFVAIILDISERLKIEQQVKASLHEKEVLLNEVHHRVKNNLAVVSSLLSMQARSADSEQVSRLLRESEGRVKSMGMIHELLYQQDNFSRIDFGSYIRKLVKHVDANFRTEDKNVQTRINSNGVYLDIDIAVPCALIINEMITNAFKHAFSGRNQGTIEIGLERNGDSLTLNFCDDGVGLPDNTNSRQLGMTLITGLVRQIGGTIHVDRHNGTRYTITFPASGI